jgi:acyl-CoA synthetase (AMP-forming)/AMP-acid ligase II
MPSTFTIQADNTPYPRKVRVSNYSLMNFCQQRMQRYMFPSEIVIIDSPPMNRHGKIVKSVLKEQIEKV